MKSQGKLLLVDDEPEITSYLQIFLNDLSYSSQTATSADEALKIIEQNEIDILITDIRMPGMNGLELMARAKANNPNMQCMIITGHGDLDLAQKAIRQGALDFICKPIKFEEVESAVIEGMTRVQLYKKLNERQAELEKTNRLLAIAKKEAELANHAKSEFLANMSHEIRTPLNGVIGITQLFCEGELTRKQQHLCKMLSTSGNTLLSLINDILDISKIESGKMELECICFDVEKLIHDCVTCAVPAIREKGLEIIVNIDPDVPLQLKGDSQRFKQIVQNLISNAVKFTDHGEIRISLSLLEEEGESVFINCTVEDTGLGIDNNAQEHIFDSFAQADNSVTRKFGGTGLGLSIVQHLAAIMGGEVGLKSDPGKGSSFWFTAKIAKQTPEDCCRRICRSRDTAAIQDDPFEQDHSQKPTDEISSQTSENNLAGKNVLLVEDNFINQQVSIELLERFHCQVRLAENGLQALEMLEDQNFDLVLMDCHMPEMDGFTATRLIRRKESFCKENKKHIPIIAMTARAMQGDREKCLEAGMDEYLSKPVQHRDLQMAMSRCMSRSTHIINSTRSTAKKSKTKIDKNVLRRLLGKKRNGQNSLVEKIGNYFLGEAPRVFALLNKAICQNDTTAIFDCAHRFKSSCVNLGLNGLAEKCGELELLAPKNSIEHAMKVLIDLQGEYEDAKSYLLHELNTGQ
ncbi:MAG: response regulator [Desulfobulbaceae bacterium]|nr:response regulator [Desulfobulbaceae bacterium]